MTDRKTNKSKKRAYLDDFVLNDQGNYEYKGLIYKPKGFIDIKKMALAIIIGFACIIIAGCIPFTGSMHAFYIIIPYMVEIALFGLLSYAFIQFAYHINELREYVYKKSFNRFKPYISILFGNIGLSILCVLVYLLINGYENWSIVYILLQIVSYLLLRYFNIYINSIKFEIEKLQ